MKEWRRHIFRRCGIEAYWPAFLWFCLILLVLFGASFSVRMFGVCLQPVSNADFVIPVEIDGTIHQVWLSRCYLLMCDNGIFPFCIFRAHTSAYKIHHVFGWWCTRLACKSVSPISATNSVWCLFFRTTCDVIVVCWIRSEQCLALYSANTLYYL